MQHFYIDREILPNEQIELTGEDHNHIKNVLRMKRGEKVVINDIKGISHICALAGFGEGCSCFDEEESFRCKTELPADIVLFQGVPKKDKMDLIIEKAVELGVSRVVPVLTKRVIVKIEDDKKEAKKLERWRAISKSAAMQSGRGIIPTVDRVMTFKQALDEAGKLEKTIIPYEESEKLGITMKGSREIVKNLKGAGSIGIFIGPEGGFETAEVEEAIRTGAMPVSLGKRILRTETAGLTALSIIMFSIEED
ncbi:MAG: 16S rRNA (uracil(1498)-N(3))-methyltransferase [Lachnospiraceae bacterium]|nr:16S rRNA (uracil(1498)-N(3))-methyltransferase [Lachnospiraceae bacterium]